MSRTSIPVDADTKERLDELKRDSETWDEFLRRLSSDEDPINAGAWTRDEADRVKEQVRESREKGRR